MKIVQGRRLAVLVFILFLTVSSLCATGGGIVWQTGRVTDIEINAQGIDAKAKTRVANGLWWTYGICNGTLTYYAVARVSPAKLGLDIDSTVTFSATTSQITLKDAHGKQYVMRILRHTESKDCAVR